MIEIPEAIVLSQQIIETLLGKRIKEVVANQTPHKFAWFYGDPNNYASKLIGKTIEKVHTYGGFIEIILEHTKLMFAEGINLRYLIKGEKIPQKHQLLIQFEDESVLVATIQMYGGLWCFDDEAFDNQYYEIAKSKPSPLSEQFDLKYFKSMTSDENLQKKSVKAVLATEQRIPGLGNGVLQDILFNAKIHPTRKFISLSDKEKESLYHAIKSTLHEMVIRGGRDTEKDLFGCPGGYVTKLSNKTLKAPCKVCGGNIIKKAYMGGSIYYCESCQVE